MMLATWRATVVGLMDSSAAMALLLRPRPTSAVTCCSRLVSELGGAVRRDFVHFVFLGQALAAQGRARENILCKGLFGYPRTGEFAW